MEKTANETAKKVRVPSFNEFNKINESAKYEMGLYTNVVDGISDLKDVYGDKQMQKTGIMAALGKINELILTGKKENETAEEAPTEETPVEDVPTDETPMEEIPMEETPAEETPAEEEAEAAE